MQKKLAARFLTGASFLISPMVVLGQEYADRIARNCTNDEIKIFYENIESLTDQPITSFITRQDVSENCKFSMIGDLLDAIKSRSEQGLCLNSWCQSLIGGFNMIWDYLDTPDSHQWCASDEEAPYEADVEDLEQAQEENRCVLRQDAADIFERADAAIGEAVLSHIEIIEDKISEGFIPVCLLPPECAHNGNECRQTLLQMWWSETLDAPDQQRISENWIESGGFTHLLLGQALTCGGEMQQGGTCGIYSGANLMSHYCATPARNPGAKPGTCPLFGPGGFKCIDADGLLEEAFAVNAWEAKACVHDKITDQETCHPVKSNPKKNEEKALLSKLSAAGCNGSGNLSGSIECRQLRDDLRKIQSVSARLYTQETKTSLPAGSYIVGNEGTTFDPLVKAYAKLGFRALRNGGTHKGWAALISSVDAGHPMQSSFYVDDWGKYWGSGNSMPHAVVIIGEFTDDQGFQRVLAQDSNLPGKIKVFKASNLEEEYISYNYGSIALCTPEDQRPYCVKAWTDNP